MINKAMFQQLTGKKEEEEKKKPVSPNPYFFNNLYTVYNNPTHKKLYFNSFHSCHTNTIYHSPNKIKTQHPDLPWTNVICLWLVAVKPGWKIQLENVKATDWLATQTCFSWSIAVQDCGHNFWVMVVMCLSYLVSGGTGRY